jgi:hypothetical protein
MSPKNNPSRPGAPAGDQTLVCQALIEIKNSHPTFGEVKLNRIIEDVSSAVENKTGRSIEDQTATELMNGLTDDINSKLHICENELNDEVLQELQKADITLYTAAELAADESGSVWQTPLHDYNHNGRPLELEVGCSGKDPVKDARRKILENAHAIERQIDADIYPQFSKLQRRYGSQSAINLIKHILDKTHHLGPRPDDRSISSYHLEWCIEELEETVPATVSDLYDDRVQVERAIKKRYPGDENVDQFLA